MTFHFLPPSPDEQKSLRWLQLGMVLSLALMGVLLAIPNQSAAPLLAGAMLAVMVNFFRAQIAYDKRKKRAEKGVITVSETGVRFYDGGRGDHLIKWDEIKSLNTQNSKLEINWSGPKQVVALREVENGMQLLEAINRHMGGEDAPPSNFIPLSSL